jgi:membrane associated rhomboid family serine protease
MDAPLTSKVGVLVLVSVHILYLLFPSLSPWLCLIPGNTFSGLLSNLLTSAFLERSPIGLVISSTAVALYGHIFEPRWGQREALRFVLVCAVTSALGSCVAVMAMYVATREERLLFVELSGFSGVVAGFAVAVHQAAHSESRGISAATPVGMIVGESRKVTMLYLIVHAIYCVASGRPVDILLAFNGLIFGWIYLRFYQPPPELHAGAAWGDASEAFAFASMFFSSLQPYMDSVSCATWRIVQAVVPPSLAQNVAASGALAFPQPTVAEPLPGSNPSLADQRRARAQHTLDERLAASAGTPLPKSVVDSV